jgi:arsenate reductase
MKPTIYGIRNCSTMKKAFDWLADAGIDHAFHDYKREGIDAATLTGWVKQLGWQALVNTRGTTWRKLDPADQSIDSDARAIALMQAHPSLIRRPVASTEQGLLVGFSPEEWTRALQR